MASSDDRVGVALFGLGRAGMIHFMNLLRNERVALLYLVERDLDKAHQTATKYRLTETKVVAADDSASVYADARVTAVVVCAPTFEHEAIVRTALENGRGVFCEKPISQQEPGIKALYELAEKVNKPLFCSFNRRFDPSVKLMRDRTLAGEIGKVHVVKTCSRDSPLPTPEYLAISGGMFHDCAVHDIDMICWVLGDYPTTVYTAAHAHVDVIRSLGDVDTVVIAMKFKDGTLATIDLSRFAAYGYDQRIEVFGSKGMLVSENQRPTELTSLTGQGTSQDVIKYSFPQRYAESYVAAIEHFLDVVQGKAVIAVSKMETLNVSAVATACEESHRTGQPVHLALTNS